MIILDDDPPSKPGSYSHVAGPTVRYPDRVVGRSTSVLTLPDYETSQALALNELASKRVVKRKVDARFWRATLYALLIYIAISAVVVTPLLLTKLKQHRGMPGPPPGPPWHASVQVSDPSSTLSVQQMLGAAPICDSWSSTDRDPDGKPYTISQSHTASPRGQFSIRSNASDSDGPQHVFGDLFVGINPDKKAKDTLVSITMQTSTPEVGKMASVCFSKVSNACDVSIYVPKNLHGSDFLRLNISLLFPQSSSAATVDKLATWLPTFTQTFGNMSTQWTFSKATIEGGSSKFDASYIQAENLLIKTSLAEIKGNFHINQSLTLDTVDAPINASILLLNDWQNHNPTHLTVDTGNGPIDTRLRLHAPRPPQRHHHALFLTSFKTFNAPLDVSVEHDSATLPSKFHLRSQNNLAESHITLDSKYEGTFNLQTKLSSATVKRSSKELVADPYGENRLRNYQLDHQSSTHIFGWIGWGDKPAPGSRDGHQGHVDIVSSHSPVTLRLDGAGVRDADSGQS